MNDYDEGYEDGYDYNIPERNRNYDYYEGYVDGAEDRRYEEDYEGTND